MQLSYTHTRVRRPGSFAERGAVVPFEAPALFAARVRADERRGLVMLLSNFAENGSVYVVPWGEAPRVLAVHGSDRALHGAIDEARASTPQAVRSVVRRVTGRVDEDGERALVRDIQTRLLGTILRDLGLDPALLGGNGHDARVAALLRMAASRIGPAAVDLLRRTETLAGDLLPLGLPGTVGPMRQLHQDVVSFERHLRRRGETASVEAKPYYRSMMRAAGDAIGSSEAWLAVIDKAVAGLALSPADWTEERRRIRDGVDRLAWILDGWEPMLDRYAAYLERRDQVFHERELAMVAALAPLLPADALPGR
jgi:hypothetical protein